MKGFVKDPDATLDYSFDWILWLNGDTINTSVWVVESPLVKSSESFTDTETRLFITGGVHGTNYEVKNTITTPGGRTDDRTVELRVRER